MKPFAERELQLSIDGALHRHEHERQLAVAREEVRCLRASLEQHVRERTAELESALSEIENIVHAVAHHLRSPLRAMEGYSHLLLTRYAANLPDPASRFPEAIGSNARRMARLVDDLLLFVDLRQRTLCPVRVDIAATAHEVLGKLIAAEPSRPVQAHIGELPACHADPVLLKQLLVELLSNALKFSCDRRPAIITIGIQTDADQPGQCVYFVRDNGIGIGIDLRYVDKLFKLFSQLNLPEAFEGTGAGLATARRIVERIGWPHLGGASTRGRRDVRLQPSDSTMSTSAPDILLAEDSPTTAELFVLALKANKSGTTVQVVRDGVEAINLLLPSAPHSESTRNTLPRLLLLDLHMPRLDGFQVLERLRADARTRLLPVVVYSSSDQESDKLEAFRRGANGYVHKPVGFKDACEILARLERDWLGTGPAASARIVQLPDTPIAP